MKIKFLAYCVSLFLMAGTVSAQDYAFKVLGSKGHNTAGTTSLKVGSKINATQTLEVGEGSYIGLAHSNGKTIEITKKGTYKVQDLVAQVNSSGSLASNYAKFVIDELTEAGSEGIAAKNRFNHMNKTGSVKRGFGSVATMLPTEKSKIFGNTLILKWYLKENISFKVEDIDKYKVEISNLNDEILFTGDFKGEQASIDLASNPKLSKESVFVCRIFPLDKEGKRLETNVEGDALVRLDESEVKQINTELVSITKDNQATALGKLIEARFFEDKELYADAIHAYEEAMKISGGTEQFKKFYQFFLERNGFTKETNEKN